MKHIKHTYKKEDAMLRPHVETTYERQARERAERRKKIQDTLNKVVKDRF
jgi:hypothetical protein